jgi:putative transposase
MVNYRRIKTGNPCDHFFFSIVTGNRRPWFNGSHICTLALDLMKKVEAKSGFQFKAWVILPDHLHWLIMAGSADYSRAIWAFKRGVSARFKKNSIISKGDKFWQDRFWEHTIRDENDYWRHVDYIHFNPVKHGYVGSPGNWQWSSFAEYVRQGIYPDDWSAGDKIAIHGMKYD